MPVSLRGGDASYDIVVGEGLLDDLPDRLEQSCPAALYVVISDATVAPLYGEEIAERIGESAPSHLVTFPAGESHKTRETWATLTDQLLAAGAGRDAAIVAVGGGVVGDVAGFVAATYLRGIPLVQVPTTLLAMIDSSIGGKTGVDTVAGKNLVGAFHQPRFVLADVSTLGTLSPKQIASGVAEALKHGAIADAGYFERTAAQYVQINECRPAAMIELIKRSVEIKVAVVSEDEREEGRRAVLNFGHTIGHALEAISGFKMSHGEAVAIGMVLEAELGTSLGITDAGTAPLLRTALEAFRLPTSLPAGADGQAMVASMLHDKKVRRREIRLTLLKSIGQVAKTGDGEWTHPGGEDAIRAAIRSGS